MSDPRTNRLVVDAVDAIEAFSDSYGHEDPKRRVQLVQLLATLCLATVLERAGPLRLARVVYGAVVAAIWHRGLVNP